MTFHLPIRAAGGSREREPASGDLLYAEMIGLDWPAFHKECLQLSKHRKRVQAPVSCGMHTL